MSGRPAGRDRPDLIERPPRASLPRIAADGRTSLAALCPPGRGRLQARLRRGGGHRTRPRRPPDRHARSPCPPRWACRSRPMAVPPPGRRAPVPRGHEVLLDLPLEPARYPARRCRAADRARSRRSGRDRPALRARRSTRQRLRGAWPWPAGAFAPAIRSLRAGGGAARRAAWAWSRSAATRWQGRPGVGPALSGRESIPIDADPTPEAIDRRWRGSPPAALARAAVPWPWRGPLPASFDRLAAWIGRLPAAGHRSRPAEPAAAAADEARGAGAAVTADAASRP